MSKLRYILMGFTLITCINVNAQRTKPQVPNTLKAIKFTSTIGGYKNGDFLAPQLADSIIGMPLKIIDEKNNAYTISSYQFLYRKIVTSEDEATGKTFKTSSVKASLFKTTPLTNIWLNAVREQLKPGEELHFFDIIVKDAKSNAMYAPDIKLTIK